MLQLLDFDSPPSIIERIQALFGAQKVTPPSSTLSASLRYTQAVEYAQTYAYEAAERLRDANPLNVALACVAVYLFVSLLRPHSIAALTPTLAKARSRKCNANNSYSFLPDAHPPTTVWRKYTPRTLAVHDGSGLPSVQLQAGANGHGGPANGSMVDTSNKAALASDADGRILLAIQGRVFDVTKGANFYGPGGPYGNFAGRDASRGMAKQSFDLSMLTPLDQPLDTLQDLSAMEMNNMREWIAHFSSKYSIVGELVNEGEQGDD